MTHGGKRANSGGRRSGAGRKNGVPNTLTADDPEHLTGQRLLQRVNPEMVMRGMPKAYSIV